MSFGKGLNVAQTKKFVFDAEENIVENAVHQHFSPFPTMFQKILPQDRDWAVKG